MSQEPMLHSNSDQLENAMENPTATAPQFPRSNEGSDASPLVGDHVAETDCHDNSRTAPATESQPVMKAPSAATGGEKGRPKGSVQICEPPVSEKRGYKVVKIEEKHGLLHQAIPVMPLWLAILCCILNILLPGTGTVISAFTVFCCGITTRLSRPVHAMGLNLISGLLQMATFLLIVGWIWSILWGMTFVQMAISATEDAATLVSGGLPYYVRRHSSVE